MRKKPPILTYGLIILVVIILVSIVVFYTVMNRPVAKIPEPEIIDCVGTKSKSSDLMLSSVKFTIRNGGPGSIDMAMVSFAWQGPSAQQTLYLDKADFAVASKENFAIGGAGSIKDGWDPSSGKFLIKGDTIAWVVINLTAAGGINDPLGPDQSIKIKLVLDGQGEGGDITVERTFKCPSSLGSGLYVSLTTDA